MAETSSESAVEAEYSVTAAPRGAKKVAYGALLCIIGVAVNYICSQLMGIAGLPLYLDCIGTVTAAALGGYIPGILVGYITNFFTSTGDPSSFYYCLTSVLIALFSAFYANRGLLGKPWGIALCIVTLTFIGGGIGSVITWCLYGAFGGGISTPFAFDIQAATGFGDFASQLSADLLIDLVDKTITVLVAALVFNLLPEKHRRLFDFSIWQQAALSKEQLAEVKSAGKPRLMSLRAKIIVVIAAVMVIVAVVTTGISYMMFHRSNIEAQGKMGLGITNMATEVIDADRVNDYLDEGEDTPGYAETQRALAEIRDSFPDVQYIYVYQILEDGCHVVFDPDTADEEGSKLGEVLPFDQAFMPYLDALLAGEPIDPIVSNESYGWLLTVYQPLYDSSNACVGYVAVDLSMTHLLEDEFAFLSRVIILFMAFLILICAIVIWLAEYAVITPIDSIAHATSSFAFDDEATRFGNVEKLRKLDVHTGDEIENLYRAVTKTTDDTMQFIADSQEKAETIERMQDNLIMVMADLVESRDKHTGDHVRKTAAYCDVVMKQMRKEGMYPDELTDEFMSNVVKSAPLHDIGKISVSDTILNKPGRLTDEEFDIMKGHTVAGKDILEDAVGAMSDPGYLDEARRLATYHHEKWNGKGYPYGLAGEDIPLSARIMAVADVFDALVSKRSYKEGMPIEKALQIIRDDAGTHFDPLVATAFLHAEDEVRKVAEQHGDAHGTAEDIRS